MTRHRPSTLAALLFCVALCAGAGFGVADAAVTLAKNSVGAKQIKTNAVRSAEIKTNAVRTEDIAPDAVTGADVKESTLGLVPNAGAVGGVKVTPVSVTVADAAAIAITSGPGYGLTLSCGAGQVGVMVNASEPFPPTVFTYTAGNTTSTTVLGLSGSIAAVTTTVEVTVFGADGSATVVAGTALRQTNSFGTDDCAFNGTVSQVP